MIYDKIKSNIAPKLYAEADKLWSRVEATTPDVEPRFRFMRPVLREVLRVLRESYHPMP